MLIGYVVLSIVAGVYLAISGRYQSGQGTVWEQAVWDFFGGVLWPLLVLSVAMSAVVRAIGTLDRAVRHWDDH